MLPSIAASKEMKLLPFTPVTPVGGSTESDTWHFVWVAWIEHPQGRSFLYGCATPSAMSTDWQQAKGVDVPGGAKMYIHESVISDSAWDSFQADLDAGFVDASSLRNGPPRTSVKHVRSILQDGFGQSGVPTRLYYTLPDIDALIGSGDDALLLVLQTLQAELNLPFEGRYATHLGNFEVFKLHSWVDKDEPFVLEARLEPNGKVADPPTYEVSRSSEICHAANIAHIVTEVAGEVTFDQLVMLSENAQRVSVPLPERPDSFRFSLFSGDGKTLLHSEKWTALNRVEFAMSVVHRQVHIDDDLSHRASSKNEELGKKAANVTTHSSVRSSVGAPATGSWRKFADQIEKRADSQIATSSEDRWFPRGIESEVGAIAHISSLIDGGRITHAVLVDPWFGEDAVQRLALRLSSHDVKLTILTSWTTIDPDTDTRFSPGEVPTERLARRLEKTAPYLASSLRVVNLVDGAKRAFHDRYLVLYPHEDPPKVFMLSNSINKVAGDWPFAMSLFAPDVAREARKYIEGLLSGTDIARNRTLNITFDWPNAI